jgi:hypothetical protein
MRFFLSLLAVVVFPLVGVPACSSEGKIGEACEGAGKTEGECESGTVCGQATSGALVCQKICNEQTECGPNEDCNGISGSLKGCRAKTGSSGSSDADAGKK